MARLLGQALLIQALRLPFCSLAAATDDLAQYNEAEALQFLEFARVSFCDDKPITNWNCGDACRATHSKVVRKRVQLIGPGEYKSVKGFAARLRHQSGVQRRCVLAYRGTVNIENWLADAKLMLYDWPPQRAPDEISPLDDLQAASEPAQDRPPPAEWCKGCQVHGGFGEAYEELRNETLASLRKLNCDLVDVTGHSLGAGVATLAAMDLRATGVQVRMLWTFGSPRVGNDAFVKVFMALAKKQGAPVASWRVVHYHDPVPQGGPSDFYTHIPDQVYYPRDSSRYEVCPAVKVVGDELVRPDCGMYKLGYSDLSGGLIYKDHVNYLNRTLALKDMHSLCVHSNYCTHIGREYTLVEMILACLVSGAMGATLLPICRRRALRWAGKDWKRFSDDESDSEVSTDPSER